MIHGGALVGKVTSGAPAPSLERQCIGLAYLPIELAATGHRRLARGSLAIIQRATRQLVTLHPNATWLAGGAIGADQVATDELLALKRRVELVLPFPLSVQGARWTDRQRRALAHQIARAAAVEVLRDTYDVAGYHERNRRLVGRADLLVAFWDSTPFMLSSA